MRNANDDVLRVLRRLAKARTQIDRALIDFWGLPERAIAWGYLGLDNSLHCALLAKGLEPGKNHHAKIEKFFEAYPEAKDRWSLEALKRCCKHWNDVRYERAQVQRPIAWEVLKLAHELHLYCLGKAQEASRMDGPSFHSLMSEVEEEQREIRQVSLEGAAQFFERHDMPIEADLQRMGLSSLAAQLAHPGRDIFLHLSSDRGWVRDIIEENQDIRERLGDLYKAFNDVVNELVVARAKQLLGQNRLTTDELVAKSPEWALSLRDFNLVCDVYYSGLALLEFLNSDEFRNMWEEAMKNPVQIRFGPHNRRSQTNRTEGRQS